MFDMESCNFFTGMEMPRESIYSKVDLHKKLCYIRRK